MIAVLFRAPLKTARKIVENNFGRESWVEYYFLSRYVEYIAEKAAREEQEETTTEVEITDWVEGNVDDNGKLLRITDPKLVQQLREFMSDQEYPRPIPAINTAMSFYGDRFPNMSFADWSKAVNNIIWDVEEAKRMRHVL